MPACGLCGWCVRKARVDRIIDKTRGSIIVTSTHSKDFPMKFDPKKTIFLIDGSSFLYRAYYGTRPLHTPQGVPVQAVYSFCRMIKKLVDSFDPSYLILVWDSKGPTTRHEMYHEYKATRQAPPSDLFEQKEYITKFADLIELRQVAKSGLEADDIMYSIAQERSKDGDMVVLITSDKDMGQALNKNTVMYDAFKDVVLDEAAFQEKMGFPVDKIIFYFALLGDSSDNIPGVKGIGDKTATELVNQFASLKDMYANLDQVQKNRVRELLATQKDNAFLSEKLFALQYHASNLTKENLAFNKANWVQARPLFRDLNFKSLLKDIDENIPLEAKAEKLHIYDFKAVTTAQQLKEVCDLLQQKKAFALDTETTGLDSLQDPMIGLSVSAVEGASYYIPCGHHTDEPQLKREEVVAALKPIFEDPLIKKYLHHAKFDALVLYAAGIELKGLAFDSMVAANLLAQDWQRIGLKYLSEYYFDEAMLTFDDVVTKFKRKDFSYVPIDQATQYAAGDAHQTLKLTRELERELADEPVLKKLYDTIEFPLVDILTRMEAQGVFVDRGMLGVLGAQVDKQLAVLIDQIMALVGENKKDINLNSPKQVEKLLFTDLNLPPQKKSAKGTGFSTDQEVLEILAPMHPVPGLILKYRELFKLKSTYIDALPMYINPTTDHVHTTFNQVAVATGRLASSDPNLQNIPASGLGLEIRAAFKPEEGHSFISADYSQIELRVLAHLSQDKKLVHAFLSGADVHTETAALLFNVPFQKVTSEQRQIGKRINFSILYGLTPFGLSKDLGIPFKDAKEYIATYFAQYPGVSAWMEGVVEETKKHGYVQTYWGRRRYIPAIYEQNKTLYEEARRVAINTKAQGTAAEIMKLGMINLDSALRAQNLDAHIVLQIHDELLISVDNAQKDAMATLAKATLESVVDWHVPLLVTTRMGKDWKEVTK